MKTNKILYLLAFGLLCSLGVAQQPERAQSGFQGLWQERTGHSLHLTYGFFVDKYYIRHAKNCLPLRFDLSYQYDIPWRVRRANFFVEVGLGYLWAHDEKPESYSSQRIDYHRASGRFGAGLKVHCTNWLYLSFGGGFNLGGLCEYWYYEDWAPDAYDYLLWGGYSAVGIVGQIKQFSISLGYRADHWRDDGLGDHMSPYYCNSDPDVRRYTTTDWFITLGVGYHF